jgi:hypothetical protein
MTTSVQQMHRLLGSEPQRVLRIAGVQYRVALGLQHFPHDGADVVFIVHNEDRFHVGPSAAASKV